MARAGVTTSNVSTVAVNTTAMPSNAALEPFGPAWWVQLLAAPTVGLVGVIITGAVTLGVAYFGLKRSQGVADELKESLEIHKNEIIKILKDKEESGD